MTDSAPQKDLYFVRETITPEMASTYLETAPAKIAYDKKAVSTYAQIMENGAWLMNAQPIMFDENGKLIDGVHRLNACVKAGVPFTTYVARNVQGDLVHTIDQHKRRSYRGVLESRGIKNAGGVVRTLLKLIRIENGALGRMDIRIPWARMDRVLRANPLIQTAVELSEESSGSALHSTARPVLIFMALQAGHEDKIHSFLRELGPNYTETMDSPPRMLANQMTLMRGQDSPYHVDEALALAVLAFNDFVAGNRAQSFYEWTPDIGDTPLNEDKEPISKKALSEHAPANLGLPLVTGYEGLEQGTFDYTAPTDAFGGQTEEELLRAANENHDGKDAVSRITLTPDQARKWLNYNQGNRKVQPNHVEMIAHDIGNDNWMLNPQPISFTADPFNPDDGDVKLRLLNGQHRLHACIKADQPIEVFVASNIPEEAFATYDTHAKRSLRARSGGPKMDDRVIQAAAKFQWRQDNNFDLDARKPKPTATDIKDTLERHPGLLEHYPRARRKGFVQVASNGVMTYFMYRIINENKAWAEEFLSGLETGENISKGNPVLTLRNRIHSDRKKLSRKEILGMLIEFWNGFKNFKTKEEAKAAKAQKEEQAQLL